jgi:hypothetical protein
MTELATTGSTRSAARLAVAFAVVVVALAPSAGLAQRGGGRPAGGGPARSAPPRAASAPRPAAPGGFDLTRDIAPAARPQAAGPAARPAGPAARTVGPAARPVAAAPAPRQAAPQPATGRRYTQPIHRAPVTVAANRNRGPIDNPRHRGQPAWSWNHDVAWSAAPNYWGGGFWGPFALGAAAVALGAALDGAYDDPTNNAAIPSYAVAPDSPGAELLASYQLTQTPCGPAGLVVIFGPNDSVICADPNTLVGPGEYDLDPATLTLESQ